MNYWPAEVAGSARVRRTAHRAWWRNLPKPAPAWPKSNMERAGWVFHQNTDQWRAAAPMDGSTWGTFSIGGAWLCTHLWEHYRYSGDKEYLRRDLSLAQRIGQFFLDTLVEYPGNTMVGDLPLDLAGELSRLARQ